MGVQKEEAVATYDRCRTCEALFVVDLLANPNSEIEIMINPPDCETEQHGARRAKWTQCDVEKETERVRETDVWEGWGVCLRLTTTIMRVCVVRVRATWVN